MEHTKCNIKRLTAGKELGNRHPHLEWLDLLTSGSKAVKRLHQSTQFIDILPDSIRQEIFSRYATVI